MGKSEWQKHYIDEHCRSAL